MESALRYTITAIFPVALIAATLTSAIQIPNVVAEEESPVNDCLDQFNGTLTSPFIAEDLVSIAAKQGTYDVSADYVRISDDILPSGFFYGLISNNTQPESAVFEEGETISLVIRSNKAGVTALEDVTTLYSTDVSDCDVVFNPSSIPAGMKILLNSVTVTDLGDGTYLHNVLIPSLGDNFTKLFIEYQDESETRVYYSLPNVEIAIGPPTGTLADATNQATGQSMFAGGRTLYGERFEPEAEVVGKVVDCATVELRKHGSPTGLAKVGFFDLFLNEVKEFGTIDVRSLTTGYKSYEFCLPSTENGHLIKASQILAVAYDDGDTLNRIDVRRSNTGAGPNYDGQAAFHVNFDTTMHVYNTEGNSRDLLFKLTNN